MYIVSNELRVEHIELGELESRLGHVTCGNIGDQRWYL